MTARSLLALFDSVYVLALTAWVGSVFFFSFGLAPILFRGSGAESGGRFAKAILPRFYAWGTTWGAIALPSLMGVPLSFPEYRESLGGRAGDVPSSRASWSCSTAATR